ncbi:hypothetical protein [Nocardia sp. NPDC051832]|uniref:tetratricopeptide repeat protein n=1 Tax=Nocardia sp. NPDC051832 TaxID=3155673 RepID=UPI003424E971
MYEPYSHLPAQNSADHLPLGARYQSADPIRWHGSLVYPMYSEQFGPAPTRLTMYTISAAPPTGLRGHGIGLSVTDGYIGIDGRQLGGVDVWSDVLTGGVTFDLTPTSPQAMFTLTPVWVDETGMQKSWMGNYGIVIEDSPDGRMVLWCSVGEGPPNFANLVVGLDIAAGTAPRSFFAAEPGAEPAGTPSGGQVAESAAPIPVSQEWFETAGQIVAAPEPEPVPVAPAIGSPEWFAASGLPDPRTDADAYKPGRSWTTGQRATQPVTAPATDQAWYADTPAAPAPQQDWFGTGRAAKPEQIAGYGMPGQQPSGTADRGDATDSPATGQNGFGADWQSRFEPEQFADRTEPTTEPRRLAPPREPQVQAPSPDPLAQAQSQEPQVHGPVGEHQLQALSREPQWQAAVQPEPFGAPAAATRDWFSNERPSSWSADSLPGSTVPRSWEAAASQPAVGMQRDVAPPATITGDWLPAGQQAYDSAAAALPSTADWAPGEIPGHIGDTAWQAGSVREPDSGMRGALYDLGVAMYSRGEEEQACGLWAQAAEAGHAAAAYDLGVVRFRSGDVGEAERWWRTAADRREPRAMAGLAELLDRQGNYAEARVWRACADEERSGVDQSV